MELELDFLEHSMLSLDTLLEWKSPVDNNTLLDKLYRSLFLKDNIFQLCRLILEMSQRDIIVFLCIRLETSILHYRSNPQCKYHKLIFSLYLVKSFLLDKY